MTGTADGSPDGPDLIGSIGGASPELPGSRIRMAGPGDAAALLRLKQRLDQETSFMMLEADERDTSVQALARDLEGIVRRGTRR
jgi:hypothetical protein